MQTTKIDPESIRAYETAAVPEPAAAAGAPPPLLMSAAPKNGAPLPPKRNKTLQPGQLGGMRAMAAEAGPASPNKVHVWGMLNMPK